LTGRLSAGRLTKTGWLAIVVHIGKKNQTGRANPMTEQNITADTDDTEGHGRARDDETANDTAGHWIRNADEDSDDVEGHRRTPRGDEEDDDVEGHRRTPRGDEDDDDVEGHAGGSRRP
jgi:hypothetical protein